MMSVMDLFLIYNGLKWVTMRRVTDKHKMGGVYQLKLNLFDDYSFKVKILSKEVVDLKEMDEDDFMGVGYSMDEYLSHPYNLKNPSSMRVKYEFEIIEVNNERLNELNIRRI